MLILAQNQQHLTGFPCILESSGIFSSIFKALKVLENRVGA